MKPRATARAACSLRAPASATLLLLLLTAPPRSAEAQVAPEAKLEVSTQVPGAQVFIDGIPEGAKTNVPIAVEPGTHELTVAADGYATYKKWVLAESGKTTVVRVELLPVGAAVAAPAPVTEAPSAGAPALAASEAVSPSPEAAWYEEWWVWGAVGAAVLGGTVLAIALSSSGDDFIPGGELGRSSTQDWMSP